VVNGTDFTGSCKSNYNAITTTTIHKILMLIQSISENKYANFWKFRLMRKMMTYLPEIGYQNFTRILGYIGFDIFILNY
jgi:hypothetical protein